MHFNVPAALVCRRATRTEGWASGSWQTLGRAVGVVALDEDGGAWVSVAAPDRELRRILVEGKGTDVDGAGESGVQAEDEPVGEAVVDEESQSGAGVFILAQSSLAKAWHFSRSSGVRSGKSWSDLRRGHAGGEVFEDVVDAEALAVEAGFPEPHTRVYREAVFRDLRARSEGQAVDVEEPVQVSGIPEEFVVPEKGLFQVGVLEGGMLQVFEDIDAEWSRRPRPL